VRISAADGVISVSFSLRYDPAKLAISDVKLGGELPRTAGLEFTIEPAAGLVKVSITGLDGAKGPNVTLVNLVAKVPADAKYGASHLLDLFDVQVNGASSPDDDGLHLVGYFGDATGDAAYSDADVDLLRRVAMGLDSGFERYPLTDPVIVGDITGNGALSGFDSVALQDEVDFLAGRATGVNRVEIPPIPDATRAAALGSTTPAARASAPAKAADAGRDDGGSFNPPPKPISLDVGPTIDWAGAAAGEAKRRRELAADTGEAKGWRSQFVTNLGQTENERNPNARMRVTGVTDKDLGKPLYKLPKGGLK
jgi:hypothetical protein